MLRAMAIAVVYSMTPFACGSAKAGCDPKEFRDISYDTYRDMTRFALLNTVSETEIGSIEQKFGGKIIIPYVNVPASGNYSQLKQQLRQVSRLTKVNLDKEITSSLLHIGWTREGNVAYKNCLDAGNGPAVLLYIGGEPANDEYAEEFVVVIKYQPNTSTEARKFAINCVTGCSALPSIIHNDSGLINKGQAVAVKIKRNVNTRLQLSASVEGADAPAILTLPSAPPTLQTDDIYWRIDTVRRKYSFCFPDSAQSDYRLCRRTIDYAPDDRNFPCVKGPFDVNQQPISGTVLGNGAELVIGSGFISKEYEFGNGGAITSSKESETSHRVCFSAGSGAEGHFANWTVGVTVVSVRK